MGSAFSFVGVDYITSVTFNSLQNSKKILRKKKLCLIRKLAYTVSSQINSLEENDLGHLSKSFIHENCDLEEIKTSS